MNWLMLLNGGTLHTRLSTEFNGWTQHLFNYNEGKHHNVSDICMRDIIKYQFIYRDHMIFSKLLTIPLTIIHVEVLTTIQDKDFMWYSSLMKSDKNIRNPNKFYHFYSDHNHTLRNVMPWKKKKYNNWSPGDISNNLWRKRCNMNK
jgi:hypothetical protein